MEQPSFDYARRELEQKRFELVERIERLRHDRQRADAPLSADFEEQAVERENDEVLEALQSSAEQELGEVTHALHRVVTGTYGLCAECGYAIEPARLRAMPYATRCEACAQSQRTATAP